MSDGRKPTGAGRAEHLESCWTRTGGLLLHSRVRADSSKKNLPPVILVHGLGVSSRYMTPTALRLAAHRNVYAPDLPGFGRSEKPSRTLNITELSRALGLWMEEMGTGRAVLLGNSIGCQVVVDLALGRPELVSQLVLVSPTVDREARTASRQFARLLLDVPRERVSLLFIALLDYLQAGLGRTAESFGYAMQDEVEEKLPHVRQPTLIVRGGRDPIVSQKWAEELSARLPASKLVVIQRAAHGINHNSPEELSEVVLEFLSS